ncbi:Uncharacterised protein [Candidatus Burarchaeum australiense]|nr:Uncharacterised protein [Candidatus Burarchaeum australiense]
MRFEIFALALILVPIANALPSCPAYPYHDFTWASNYAQPARPPDSLIDNCKSLNLVDKSVCDLANLSAEEKKNLIADNLVRDNGFANFDDARNWNYGLAFTKYPPDAATVVNNGSIRDAWVKMISLTPSVFDASSKQLFVNDTGELYSQYAFSFVVPQETFSGDCKTEYDVCGYDYSLQSYRNGAFLGNGKKTSFAIDSLVHNSSSLFSSVLSANSEYLIHHYKWVTHCSGSGKFVICVTTCDYSSTESRKNSVRLTDAKTAYYYGFTHFQNSMIDSFKNGLIDGWFFLVSNEDFNNFKLNFGNAWLKIQSRQYKLAHDLAPYNALTPEALVNDDQLHAYNVVVLSRQNQLMNGAGFDEYLKATEPFLHYVLTQIFHIDLTVLPIEFYGDKTHYQVSADKVNCSLEVHSHFESWNYGDFCGELNQTPVIKLELLNSTNETIEVKATFYDNETNESLTGKKLMFSYAGQNQTVETDEFGEAFANFAYSPVTDIVYAEFLTDFQTKSAKAILILPPREPGFFETLWYWFVVLLVAYLLYTLAKRMMT